MNARTRTVRTAAICMVYNAQQYLSEFLLYHLNLVDHIYLIDHKSRFELRGLDLPNVTVVRSNQVAQFQSECLNVVIEKLGLRDRHDWLFPLDIDEFLPFVSRDDLNSSLEKWSGEKVLHFTWRNGVPSGLDPHSKQEPESLIEYPEIIFHKHANPTVNIFVNLRRTGSNFFIHTGNHHVGRKRRPFKGRFRAFDRWALFRSVPTGLSLFHIVSLSKDSFVKKIQNYMWQMGMRSHVTGQGGWMVRDYPTELTDDEWLWHVVNFRLSDKGLHHPALRTDFVPVPLFEHLDKEAVRRLRRSIGSLPQTEAGPQSDEEIAYLSQKTDDTAIGDNIRWFDLTDANEVVCIHP